MRLTVLPDKLVSSGIQVTDHLPINNKMVYTMTDVNMLKWNALIKNQQGNPHSDQRAKLTVKIEEYTVSLKQWKNTINFVPIYWTEIQN